MKKIVLLLISLSTLHVSAQRVTVDNVPDEVSKAFKAKFSIAEKTTWAVDDDNYLADFKVGNADFTATFDRTGKWLKTQKFIKSAELPKAVRDAITKELGQLSNYTYESAEKQETEKNVVYKTNIKRGEVLYKMTLSEKGEILKKTEEEDD